MFYSRQKQGLVIVGDLDCVLTDPRAEEPVSSVKDNFAQATDGDAPIQASDSEKMMFAQDPHNSTDPPAQQKPKQQSTIDKQSSEVIRAFD